ncbi:reticulon-like protein [Striga asiatica]|uniref:Reticulon-like protein n=1 Tax=Striga asiatica TaxID=4170 RepID=A0A5A7PBL4_STRAF|nr:reticulon-like protein [Striga asiatica]
MDKKANEITRVKQSPPIGSTDRRKTWKSDNSEGNSIQIARQRYELRKNLDKEFKESGDENVKNAIQLRKVKSDSTELVNCDKIEEKNDEINNSEPNRDLKGSDGDIDKSPDRGISRYVPKNSDLGTIVMKRIRKLRLES